MFRPLVCALGFGLALGCKSDPPKHESPPPPPVPVKTEDPCRNAKAEGPLSWIADDYPNALACARQKKVPLVLDLWAPWCHTCLSMQTTVLMDKSFADDQAKFVFATLDTDRESNAPALAKLAISAWPTFYVVSSVDEVVLARFVGAATVGEFHEFIDAGARALINNIAAGDAHLLGAERALAVKDYATAETELLATLDKAPTAWLRRPSVLNSLILTKWKRFDLAGCMDIAEKYMDQTGLSAIASDFLVTAMSCADAYQPKSVRDQAGADPVKTLRQHAVARWQTLLADPGATLSVDDRSDAMASLRETLDALGDKAGAKTTAQAQRKLLDDAAAKATSPIAAMTFNWPRAEVYDYLKVPLELVPALEKSAKDLPKEYDPRARLGWIYLKAGKLDDAAKWTDEALALVYGPRKGKVLQLRADIAAAAKDSAGQRKYLDLAVKLYESLPPAQQNPEVLAKTKQALIQLDAGSASGSAGSGSAAH